MSTLRWILRVMLGFGLAWVFLPIVFAIPVALFIVALAGVPGILFWPCFIVVVIWGAAVFRSVFEKFFFGRGW